jgi:hypothetical protein
VGVGVGVSVGVAGMSATFATKPARLDGELVSNLVRGRGRGRA